jgi:4-aminobutyrate aminotransferase-like enzyme
MMAVSGDVLGMPAPVIDLSRILAGLTGPGGTVLKVRPPLIWRTGEADLFAAAVAAALSGTG